VYSDPADRGFAANHAFLVEARKYWMADVYGALRREYATLSAGAGREAGSPAEVAQLLDSNTTYAFYAWMERHIQKQRYSGRWGFAARLAALPATAAATEGLKLDPDVKVPTYYAAIDTHQHPGNLTGADNAGVVYKASAQGTQPGATAGYELHERFAAVLANLGRFDAVLDLGCGFGKSALPIASRNREARVVGIDLSAPCLRLAAHEAQSAGLANLRYEQADVRNTGHADGEFDLVTSTMVLHELDVPALRDMLRESYRVLAPGGTAVHLDFQVDDPFLGFLYHGHALRNNEPYMPQINALDMAAELKAAGFDAVQIEPFEETPGATAADWPKWRFPWASFVARKPAR
jgi:ubiquinone/menaquinone biosynthesis C-methylase UbiE